MKGVTTQRHLTYRASADRRLAAFPAISASVLPIADNRAPRRQDTELPVRGSYDRGRLRPAIGRNGGQAGTGVHRPCSGASDHRNEKPSCQSLQEREGGPLTYATTLLRSVKCFLDTGLFYTKGMKRAARRIDRDDPLGGALKDVRSSLPARRGRRQAYTTSRTAQKRHPGGASTRHVISLCRDRQARSSGPTRGGE